MTECSAYVTLLVLMYNSPIWSPHYVKDIIVIERVQKFFTKNLKGMQNKSYAERLSILKLLHLSVDELTLISYFYIKLFMVYLASIYNNSFL